MRLLLLSCLSAALLWGCQAPIDAPTASQTQALSGDGVISVAANSGCGTGTLPFDTTDVCIQCFDLISSRAVDDTHVATISFMLANHNRYDINAFRVVSNSSVVSLYDRGKPQEADAENDIAIWELEVDVTVPASDYVTVCLYGDTAGASTDLSDHPVQASIVGYPTWGSRLGLGFDLEPELLSSSDLESINEVGAARAMDHYEDP